MTEQEFTKIRTLITGLMGITELKSTIDRCDEALQILDRDKQLLIHGVVEQSEQLCHLCNKPLKEGVSIDYCTNLYCIKERA